MRLRYLFLVAAALLAAGCMKKDGSAKPGPDTRLRVVATTGMIADIAKNLGGPGVTVTALMGAGVDPHLYKASAGDVELLGAADLILHNGLHLESRMGEVIEEMGSRRRTVAVSSAISRDKLRADASFGSTYDPHIWFDVSLWIDAAGAVRDAMAAADPAGAAAYGERYETFAQALRKLDDYVRARAQELPAQRRVLVTAHDAFNYFGRAYGFEVRGLQGISTVAEAGAADVKALAQFISERKIPAIFVESSVPRKNVEALRAAVRSRGFEVRIGGELFSDAMGAPGTPEGTYEGMVRHNIDTIASALAQETSP